MNNSQTNFSYQEQPQNTESIGGDFGSKNHIQNNDLKSFLYKKNGKNIVCFTGGNNLIEYAFYIGKQITAVNKFELGTLNAQWVGQKSKTRFLPKIIKDSKNIDLLNKKIDDYINNQSKQSELNLAKNPNFPDNTYIYTNSRGKNFKVVTIGGKAINISCENNYITGHQKAAIQRAINENRLDKFQEFIPESSTQLSVVDRTNKILEGEYLGKEPGLSNIDNVNFYENIRQKILDSSNLILSADHIENIYAHVENFKKNDFPSIKELEAAQSFIAIMYKRTGVDKNTISDLLQNGATIHYMFNNINESIGNEGYNVSFIQVLLQLSEIIKNIFLSTVMTKKRVYH